MFQFVLIPSRRKLALFTFLLSVALPAPVAADARVSESYGKLPLHFEANQGQTHEDVRFLARGSGYSLYLTSGEAVFVLIKASPDKKSDWHRKRDWRSEHERPKVQGVVLRMAIVGAAPAPLVSGLDELSGKANYFIGNDPAKWRTNVSTYAKVHYREVYPGIDLVYYGNQRQLEYDFIVAPGADPGNIVLGFQGADRLEVKAEGELVLHLAGRAVRQKKPVIYQEIDGVRREIAGGYVLQGANQVGFEVAAYDRSRPLIIDPVVLSYSTYLGGSDREGGSGIAVDVDGNAFVTGQTSSLNFPTTAGAFQTSAGADCTPQFPCLNAFVTKLNPTGSALVYSTYLGGSSTNSASGVAVDSDGNAYVMGTTGSIDFPTTIGAFQPIYGGGYYDAFVTKLNSTGSALLYSTYLGGNGYGDWGHGIAVDVDGNAYVTGETMSNNFPTTVGAFQTVIGGGGSCGSPEFPSPCNDAFVTKLNPAGSALVYSTYLGGRSGEWGNGIAVDASGSAYVTGWTSSYTDFPTTVGAFQMTGNSWDAFVTKLHPTGSSLIYSTHLGGSDDGRAGSGGGYGYGKEQGYGIAVDVDGNAYVTGETTSIDFPTTAGAFQPAFGGGRIDGGDAFVAKLNPTGSALIYSTYLGGGGVEYGSGIAVDASGHAYVTGSTDSTNFPTLNAFQGTSGGGRDAFVTKLDPTGSAALYSTLLGGSSRDGGGAIAVSTAGSAYVAGGTSSVDFPVTTGSFQPTYGGDVREGYDGDVFVAKIADDTSTPPAPTTTRSEESAASYTGSWTSYGSETGTFSGGAIVASNAALSTAKFSFAGTGVTWIGVRCEICGIATVSIDGGVPTVVNTFRSGGGSLTSEPVFSASGLAPGVNHTMVITVTGTTTSLPALPSGTHIAVDAFEVSTGGGAAPPLLPPLALPPLPVVPPLPPVLGL